MPSLPYALAGQTNPEVVVKHFDLSSPPLKLPLLDTSPGIFTATQTGTGQAAIRQLGPDSTYSYNSADNPAAPGTAFEMYCTGAGVWTPPVAGDISLGITLFQTQPVSVTIGGRPAKVLYAGNSGGQSVWGLLQVNVVVPGGVGSGPQPIVLKIGPNDNALQQATIAVK